MLLQIALTFLLTLTYVVATPPPGYQKKEDPKQDKNVPKYNYGYKIAGTEGSQEKQEQRDGIYALGRYYVNGVDSKQSVEYLADDWGFHPFIEYSNTGPHSKSSTQIAFGEEAVKALRNSNKNEMSTKEEVERNIQQVQPQFVAQLPPQQQPNLVYITHSLPPTAQSVPLDQSNILVISNQPQANPTQSINIGPTQQSIDNQAVVYQTEAKGQNENVAAQQQQQVVYVDNNQPPIPNGYVIDQNQLGYQVQYADQNTYYTIPPNQENIILIPTAGPTPSGPFYVQGPTLIDQSVQQVSNYEEKNKEVNQKDKEINVQIIEESNKTKLNEVKEYQQQNLISASSSEENFSAEAGLFGTKISTKLNVQPQLQSNELKSSKLIENTKNLVTGQDVLNINEVLNQHVDSVIQADVSKSSEYSFSTTIAPSVAYVSTDKPKEVVNLSKDPIIVADLDENKLNVEEKGEFYSTTRSTVETVNTVTSLGSQTTVVVTPRPVGTTFLAPITAGVQLETSNEKESAQQLKSSIVVDIQKSVPYYLGRFEYVHGPNGYEELNNVAYKTKLQKTLLQYTEPLPSPQPLIQQISEEGSKVQFTGYENHVQESSDQQRESGQVHYQIQTPYQLHGNIAQQDTAFNQNIANTYIQKPINNKVKYHPLIQNLQTEIVTHHKHQPGVVPMHLYIAAPDINPVVDLTKHFVVPTTYQPHVIHLPLIQNSAQPNHIQNLKIQQQQQNSIIEHQKEVQKQQYAILQQQKEVQKQIQDHEAQSSLQYASQHQSLSSQSLNNHEVLSKTPINEQKVHITQPYAIEVPKPYPVAVTKLIPQRYPITLTNTGKAHASTPVEVKVPHAVPKYIERPYPIYVSKDTQQKFEYNPYVYAPKYQANCDHLKQQQPDSQGIQDSSSYVPSNQPTNYYHTIHLNDYLGLKPPKPKPSHKFIQFPRHTPNHQLPSSSVNHNYKMNNLYPNNYNVYGTGHVRKYRNPRQSFENLRIEYGFMPPLIPSIEIDENGKPIEKPGKE